MSELTSRDKNFLSLFLFYAKETIEREFGAFKPISDAAPKYVLSLDRFDYSRDGIAHLNIIYVPEIATIATKYLNAILSGEYAFYYHEFTDVIPEKYSILFNRG